MANWRDELNEAVKTKAERDAEEKERHRKRVEEALTGAREALRLAKEALTYAKDKLVEKDQEAHLEGSEHEGKLVLKDFSLGIALDVETAVLKVSFADAKPREFDFAKDRHIAPGDVEEYIGRRSVELVKAAQKATPW